MNRLLTIICLLLSTSAFATDADTTSVRRSLVSKMMDGVSRLFDVDTTYVEPNHYKFQVYLTNNYSYEVYRLTDNNGNTIQFEPKPTMKIGPYICWNIAVLGWTIDVLHLNDRSKRKEFDLSFSTQPLAIDLFYRMSGDEYTIKDININGIDTRKMENAPFHGLESSVVGLNMYYIFNNNKFSHPSAFNMSTRQKRSAGSPLAGIGFTRHSLNIDWNDLDRIAQDRIGQTVMDKMHHSLQFEKVTYTDLSISGGYGYNWVFARNLLVAASLSVALSHKRSISESTHGFDALGESIDFTDFKFSDLTLDGTGRLGFVWNNDRWFAGANVIMHTYNYSRQNFYTNNIFGSVNIYAGLNFGVFKKFRKHKRK